MQKKPEGNLPPLRVRQKNNHCAMRSRDASAQVAERNGRREETRTLSCRHAPGHLVRLARTGSKKFLYTFSSVYLAGVDVSLRVNGNLMDPVKLAGVAPVAAKGS
jgi:hypothetical protein